MKLLELQEIENSTKARLKKLKEAHQVSLNVISSFSYIAIGILILFPIIIISCDLLSFASGLRRQSRRYVSSVVPEKNDKKINQSKQNKDERVFIRK